ncbi:hypothetical protein [Flavobacterium akiainvivens]|nr:hypothetical protein [Flavobacterium akiainvivens]
MCVNEMIRLASQIQALGLPEEQEEVLMVQAADLVRFKESYPGNLELVDPFSKVSIVSSEAITAGVCFYGSEDKGALKLMLGETRRLKRLKRVKELWFVYVSGAGTGRESLNGIIDKHRIKQLCSRVFVLNYNAASVQLL